MGVGESSVQCDERPYREIFASVSDPLFVLQEVQGKQLVVIEANAASGQWFQIPAKQCLGKQIDELLSAPSAPRLTEFVGRSIHGDGKQVEFRIDFDTTAGCRVY